MRTLFHLLCLTLLGATSAFSQDDKVMELGKATFQACVACHGPDGKGIKAGDLLMAPSLHDSLFIKENHPELLTGIILKGILKEDNKYIQAMLTLEAALDDEQIAALIAYVTKEFGGKRQSVKPAAVARWRKEFKSRTSPWKRKDLEGLLKEANAPKLISDVTYSVYEGNWKKLPAFASLAPVLGAGALPAKWVIHTVGPNYAAGERDRGLLESCYVRSLEVADELGATSVAFPLISAGVYAWPKQDAIDTAVGAIRTARTQVERVSLVAFDEETARQIESSLG